MLDERIDDSAVSEKGRSSFRRQVLRYLAAIAFIVVAGTIAWAVNTAISDGDSPTAGEPEEIREWRSQLMGWISALLYRE